ncbi:hypothetical protein MJO28_002023 [Puccinia striiformis f. sp. tritici]|uniref:Uncharacterized protein n=1 Tax=Puccinia striiformis f. sp. tritici TaxID=168172 RepID=A0ACC0EXN7_9BASI|nr:hypothetical protein MJO28_002023 [Puccinia striiformis f. sp. tritici]
MELRLAKKHYSDGIQFIQILQLAAPSIEKLLASKVKSEVLEAIYFFKTGWNHRIKGAQDGIKQMLHLICSSENLTVEETTKDVAPGKENVPKELKEIKVHLELVEREFKRREADSDELKKKQNSRKANQNDRDKDIEGDELDQVAGNVEDDIGDVCIAHAREKERLFGKQCLLSVFAPTTVQISVDYQRYTRMKRCKRQQLSRLGNSRLTDSDLEVEKNTLMVLTHLIPNGMIQVKGRLHRPDMISHLSVGKHAVDVPLFQSVMDNISKHLKE